MDALVDQPSPENCSITGYVLTCNVGMAPACMGRHYQATSGFLRAPYTPRFRAVHGREVKIVRPDFLRITVILMQWDWL